MLLQQITDIIVNVAHCNPDDVVPEARLSDLGVDSLASLNVVFQLEDTFNVDIPNEMILEINTVQDILDKIQQHDIIKPVHG